MTILITFISIYFFFASLVKFVLSTIFEIIEIVKSSELHWLQGMRFETHQFHTNSIDRPIMTKWKRKKVLKSCQI